ncbi:DUF1289 domain-containing protein [Poseidonocella sp. HB161398]|uniref:DUF1289 domain-containing protein n=1 Tax=Poseidonocella sp. HB161398 TaxID=2320855 RepID=UPI0011098BA4|nr:DUF1289 domain-containing protein [Poseidonocella sp. HB161398]
MGKLPSPCLDVCKFRLEGGRCIACAMTKKQKKSYKGLSKDKKRRAFIAELLEQQAAANSAKGWQRAYLRKCAKKGAEAPF